MSDILVPISPGELLDKLTILRIKLARIGEPARRANVQRELELLEGVWARARPAAADLQDDIEALAAVNARLWDIEDRIRDCERAQRFDAGFIALARSVYIENDARAALKRRINERLGATLIEEKSYSGYR